MPLLIDFNVTGLIPDKAVYCKIPEPFAFDRFLLIAVPPTTERPFDKTTVPRIGLKSFFFKTFLPIPAIRYYS